MSGHGRPPLCKAGHVSRARELCARRHQSRSAGARLLGETAKRPAERAGRAETSNPQEMGPFPTAARSGGNPAETGGNPLQQLCSRNRPEFYCLTQGVQSKP